MPSAAAIRAGRAFVEMGVETGALKKGLRDAEDQLRSFANGVKRLGITLTAVGVAATAPFVKSAKVFADYESVIARIRGIAKAAGGKELENLDQQMATLEQDIRFLGRTTVFTATQVAQAAKKYRESGVAFGDITRDVLGRTLQFAVVGNLKDVEDAADQVIGIMKGMGLEFSRTGDVIDVLSKAMATARTTAAELAQAFQYVGPIAGFLGLSLEEVTAALQILSEGNLKGQKAGVALRGILASINAPTAEAQKNFEKYGIALLDVNENARPVADVLDDIFRVIGKLGTGAQLNFLRNVAKVPLRQLAGATRLLADAKKGGLRERIATLRKREGGGAAATIAGEQLDTLAGSAIIFKSAIQDIGISIGKILAPALRILAEGATLASNLFSGFIQQNPQVVRAVALVAIGITTTGIALTALGLSLKISITSFATLLSTLKVVGIGYQILAGTVIATASAFKLASAVTYLMLKPLFRLLGFLKGARVSWLLYAATVAAVKGVHLAFVATASVAVGAINLLIRALNLQKAVALTTAAAIASARAATAAAAVAWAALKAAVGAAVSVVIIGTAAIRAYGVATLLAHAAMAAFVGGVLLVRGAVAGLAAGLTVARTGFLLMVASAKAAGLAVITFARSMTLAQAAIFALRAGMAGMLLVQRGLIAALVLMRTAIVATVAAVKTLTVAGVIATGVVAAFKAAIIAVKLILAALASPIGLAVAAAALLAANFQAVRDTASSLAGSLGGALQQGLQAGIQAFLEFKDRAVAAFKGISAAIQAGDITLAMQVLWAALKLEWAIGVKFLVTTWFKLQDTVVDSAFAIFYGTLSVFNTLFRSLQLIWIELTELLPEPFKRFLVFITDDFAFLRKFFVGFWDGLVEGFNSTISFIRKVWTGFVSFFLDIWGKVTRVLGFGSDDAIKAASKKAAELGAQAPEGADPTSRAERRRKALEAAEKREQELRDQQAKGQAERDKARQEARKDILAKLDKDIVDAEQARDEIVKKALQAQKDAAEKLKTPDLGDINLGKILDTAGGLGQALKEEVVGTFSAFRLDQIGAKGLGRQQLEELQKVAKNTKEIAKKFDNPFIFV